jgi:hypothetical protein
MRVLAPRWFARFARSEGIGDERLCDAIERAGRRQIDADLGRGLIKQRVARPGAGRSGGFRVLIAYRHGVRAVFLYGFAKNERDNIDAVDLATWQKRAREVQSAGEALIDSNVADGRLTEIECDEEKKA